MNHAETTPQPEDKMPQHCPSASGTPAPGTQTLRPPTPMLRYFKYEHLPPQLQQVSGPVGELARVMDAMLPDGAEKAAGLRKLLEAKDCFVRAALPPS